MLESLVMSVHFRVCKSTGFFSLAVSAVCEDIQWVLFLYVGDSKLEALYLKE